MEALAAEIARKRKERSDASAIASGGAAPADGKRKWVKKGDLEKAKVAQYREAEAKDEEERSKKTAAPQFRHVIAGNAIGLAPVTAAAGPAADSADGAAGEPAAGGGDATAARHRPAHPPLR